MFPRRKRTIMFPPHFCHHISVLSCFRYVSGDEFFSFFFLTHVQDRMINVSYSTATVKKRGDFKKTTDGNAKNLRLINCPDVTKIGKTRVVRGRKSKMRRRSFSLKVCCKRWRRSKNVHHIVSCTYKTVVLDERLLPSSRVHL